MSRPDIAVVGLGPAGRALAHRLGRQGARVLAIDPRPQRIWEPTYGGWAHQLPGWLPGAVVGAQAGRTRLVARSSHVLAGRYVVLDNAELHRALPLDQAEVVAEAVADPDLPDLADVVVDCRGARADLDENPRPMQTAYGVRLPREVGTRLLGDADAVLMDWRPFDGARRWGTRRPSFCYVIPLPDGRVLAEETCLAGDPAIEVGVLADRLATRLDRSGVDVAEGNGDVEVVRIPMLPPPTSPVPRFGSAGDELNPITGYSVFASLAFADEAARSLRTTGALPVRRSPRRLGLQALLHLRPDAVVDLFDAFGRLPESAQRAVFDPHSPAPALLTAMLRQWTRMPARSRLALVTATATGVRS